MHPNAVLGSTSDETTHSYPNYPSSYMALVLFTVDLWLGMELRVMDVYLW